MKRTWIIILVMPLLLGACAAPEAEMEWRLMKPGHILPRRERMMESSN